MDIQDIYMGDIKAQALYQGDVLIKSWGFLFTIDTTKTSTGSSTATQYKLPLHPNGNYNFIVFWGDGTSSSINTYANGILPHTYGVSGIYTVEIIGIIRGWYQNNVGDRLKIKEIKRWGQIHINAASGTQGAYFYGCSNLVYTAVDLPMTTGLTSLKQAFAVNSKATTIPRLTEWGMPLLVDMSSCFSNCTIFNQNIDALDTANVTNLSQVFLNCSFYNNPVNSWDVSNATSISGMFSGARRFNQPLDNWDISKASQITELFFNMSEQGLFNQSLRNWNFSAATDFGYIGYGLMSFDAVNYDDLLIAISTTNNLTGKYLEVWSYYTAGGAGETARNVLLSRGWTITDFGGI